MEMTVDKIPDDIKVLVVIHPKGISEARNMRSINLFCAAAS